MTNRHAIPEVKLANVVPGVAPLDVSDKGVNETFICLIQTAADQHRVYIKVLEPRQLVNELICSTLGLAVGLPIPEGLKPQTVISLDKLLN